MTDRVEFAKYYPVARTAHVERIRDGDARVHLFYETTRSDFDEELVSQLGHRVHRITFWKFLSFLVRSDVKVLEVPEPFAIRLWPQLVTICFATKMLVLITGRRIDLVTYCIENYNPVWKLSEFTRLPTRVGSVAIRAVAGFIVKNMRRVVFGTDGALDVYRETLPQSSFNGVSILTIPALPSPVAGSADCERSYQVCFLGTFEERKGILDLMQAWDAVEIAEEQANLVIMGKGPLSHDVKDFVSKSSSASLLFDPSRRTIFETLSASKVLVLLSKGSKGWREQVGLPIVEGLSVGCEVVTTQETGIAKWLKTNGHRVVPPEGGPVVAANAIVAALKSTRTPAELLDLLPTVDSRVEADRWMMG